MLSWIDPETLHEAAIGALDLVQRSSLALAFLERRYRRDYSGLAQRFWDIEFDNPLGLAAGWDKSARVPAALAAFGFSFLELGTVTLRPEKGHPRPRIFKSARGQWILNRVGFANDGLNTVAGRLRHLPHFGRTVLGVSLGKMLASPRERLGEEVVAMIEALYPQVSFFSVNISSPNTPQGHLLSEGLFLRQMIKDIKIGNRRIALRLGRVPKPVFVKISSVVDTDNLKALAKIFMEEGVNGVIAVNSLPTPRGGLSGRPLRETALATTAGLFREMGDSIPIIGVGGILTGRDAWERITAGASLIQIFSGFVLRGPGLVAEILEYLEGQIKRSGFREIGQARGIYADRYA